MLLKEWVEGLGAWTKPNQVVALEHGSRLSGLQDLYSLWKTNVSDLDELGQCHVLYFTYLKKLIYVLGFCSLLVSLALFALFSGELFQDEILVRFSLGNFGTLYDSMAVEGEEEVSSLEDLATLDFSKLSVRVVKLAGVGLSFRATDLMFYLAVMDVAALWFFFLSSLAMRLQVARRVKRHERDKTTIGKYSVRFDNIPRIPEQCSKWELVEYFDNFGTVVDMNLCLADEDIITLARKRDASLSRLEKAVAQVQQARGNDAGKFFHSRAGLRRCIKRAFALKEKVHKLSTKLKHLQATRQEKDPIGGFITFREAAARRHCLAQHGLAYRAKALYDKADCFMGRHVLRVSEAPEPDDLLRENLAYSKYVLALPFPPPPHPLSLPFR